MQSPVATKDDQDNKPEGSAKGSTEKGPEPASAPAQTTAWNPFKSRARAPLPPEPMPTEEEEENTGDGKKANGKAKGGRSAVAVPSDHEILTSLPPDKIWGNMQQHASEGTPFNGSLRSICLWLTRSGFPCPLRLLLGFCVPACACCNCTPLCSNLTVQHCCCQTHT